MKIFPLMRAFHGYQFYLLYKNIRSNNFREISNIINSISLNKIKNTNFKFLYNDNVGEIENILCIQYILK